MLDNGHEAVGDDGCTDLNAYRIFGCSPELLDFEMLLQLFVKQFYLPTVLVQVGYFESRQVESIRQESEVAVLLFIMIADQSEPFGILLMRCLFRKNDLCICKYVLWQPTLPLDAFELQVPLGSYYEVGFHLVDSVELPESIITTVENVVRALLVGNLIHGLGVMHRRCRDMVVGRDGCFQIVQEVHLHPAFLPSELSPPKDRKA